MQTFPENRLKQHPAKELSDLLIKTNCFVGGGYVRSCLTGDQISDIDVFGTDQNIDTFSKLLKENGAETLFDSNTVKTFLWKKHKIQVIRRQINTVQEFFDHVDFTICGFAWNGKEFFALTYGLIDLFNKKLIINKLKEEFVVDSLRRMQKYIQRGFTICDGGLKDFVTTIRAANQEQINESFEFYSNGEVRVTRFD